MADAVERDIDRAGQAGMTKLSCGVRIEMARTGTSADARSFSHREPGCISRAFAPMPMRASSEPECGEAMVIRRSTCSLPKRAS